MIAREAPLATTALCRSSLRFWSRRPRIGSNGASAGCARNSGCRPAKLGKPSSTTECLCCCGNRWTYWPKGTSSSATSTSRPLDCPALARPMPCAPLAMVRWSQAALSSSPRPTGRYRTCRQPSATWPYRVNYASWTPSTSCSWMPWANLPRTPRNPRCSSCSSPNATACRSLGITSNLVFSEWELIFANPMATAAPIDRVVHQSASWNSTCPATAPAWPSNAVNRTVNSS